MHSLRRGAAEALEAIAHGDSSSSMVVGRRIDEIDLPPGTTIGAIVRGEEVVIAHHDTIIESAKTNPSAQRFLEGKTIRMCKVIPGKLVTFAVS